MLLVSLYMHNTFCLCLLVEDDDWVTLKSAASFFAHLMYVQLVLGGDTAHDYAEHSSAKYRQHSLALIHSCGHPEYTHNCIVIIRTDFICDSLHEAWSHRTWAISISSKYGGYWKYQNLSAQQMENTKQIRTGPKILSALCSKIKFPEAYRHPKEPRSHASLTPMEI